MLHTWDHSGSTRYEGSVWDHLIGGITLGSSGTYMRDQSEINSLANWWDHWDQFMEVHTLTSGLLWDSWCYIRGITSGSAFLGGISLISSALPNQWDHCGIIFMKLFLLPSSSLWDQFMELGLGCYIRGVTSRSNFYEGSVWDLFILLICKITVGWLWDKFVMLHMWDDFGINSIWGISLRSIHLPNNFVGSLWDHIHGATYMRSFRISSLWGISLR